MSHMVFYESEKGILVGITEWRSRPLDARRSIRIFDLLKKEFDIVIRYEDFNPVEMKNGLKEGPGTHEWNRTNIHPHHYEDGVTWDKNYL